MAKRIAGTDLNHDNWNEDDEPEDPGTFAQADNDAISKRKIVRAKRRAGDVAPKPVGQRLFSGFGGFNQGTASKANGDSKPAFGTSTGFTGFSSVKTSPKTTVADTRKPAAKHDDAESATIINTDLPVEENDRAMFLGALKGLNESFVSWLDKHVKQNPFCYFMPAFADYNNHVEKIRTKYNCSTTKPYKPLPSDGSMTGTSTNFPLASSTTSALPAVAAAASPKSSAALSQPLFTMGTNNSPKESSLASPRQPFFPFGSPSSTDKPITTESNKPVLMFDSSASKDKTVASEPFYSFGSTSASNTPEKPAEAAHSLFSFSKGVTASPPEKDDSKEETSFKVDTTQPLFSFNKGKTASPSKDNSKDEEYSKNTDEPKPVFSFGSAAKLPPDNKSDSSTTTTAPAGVFMFGKAASPNAPTFNFGAGAKGTTGGLKFGSDTPALSASSTSAPTFFGSGALQSKGFSFGSKITTESSAKAGVGFSFKDAISSPAQPAAGQSSGATKEEEYEPPKPVVENQIIEEDAVYAKRVKLFYEKEGKYMDRGIGNLFIKPLDSGKYSVLVRADTNLGNILLNIVLAQSIPVARVGNNHVSIVCIVNPPISEKDPSDKLYTLLVKVKTAKDADELKEKLMEYKK